MPSKRETLTVVVIMALFLLLTGIFIGLRSEHLLMAVLYLVLFFAGLPTRKLAVALLPFAIFGISYDWMRICPNYEVNPIDKAIIVNNGDWLLDLNYVDVLRDVGACFSEIGRAHV